jgi:hypothetical protein
VREISNDLLDGSVRHAGRRDCREVKPEVKGNTGVSKHAHTLFFQVILRLDRTPRPGKCEPLETPKQASDRVAGSLDSSSKASWT